MNQVEQSLWDDQLDRDAAAGKLDFLFDEAAEEESSGLTRPWPPPTDRDE